MKTLLLLPVIGAGLVLLATATLRAETGPPSVNADAFDRLLSRDVSEIPAQGPVTGSYAEVVRKILPSVASISTYSATPGRDVSLENYPDDLDHLPPMFREFFGDWLGRREPRATPERRRPLRKRPVRTGLGSGVVITADGYLLTNNHVVENADELKVEIAGNGREFTAKVIGTDPQTDVALIKIEAEGLTPAILGDSSRLHAGDVLLAVGSPMGLEHSVTHGIVSGLGRSELGIIGNPVTGQPGYENFIQTDAAINPGNSGGPLLDALGRVVGLNTAIETRSGMFAGIGLAIPINMALSVARDLLRDGKVRRGFLGIEMDQVDASMADHLGLEPGLGVMVNSVVADSPAARAGFQEGDAIVEINGQKVVGPAQLRLIVSAHHPGTEVTFRVIRHQPSANEPEALELVAKLQALPEEPAAAPEKNAPQDTGSGQDEAFIRGVILENLSDETRLDYGIAEEVEGVLVASVDKDSPAAGVLEEGDVIIQVNRQSVRDIAGAIAGRDQAGSAIRLKILREDRTRFVVVKP
jgi:serine protease Do